MSREFEDISIPSGVKITDLKIIPFVNETKIEF